MDCAPTAAFTSTKTMEALAAPVNRKLTNLTTSPNWPQKKPKLPDFYAFNSFLNPSIARNLKNRKTRTFIIPCSTKPNTDKESATNEYLTVGPSSNSRIQEQATSDTANPVLSSASSSSSRGLVFDLGSEESWDSAEIGSPVVRRYLSDEEERWYMWYHGRSNGSPAVDSVGLAVSSNGIHWERGAGAVKSSADVGLVMNCSTDWWAFDTQGIRPCEVVVMSSAKVRVNNSLYWLYYTGFNSEKVEFLNNSLQYNLENPERAFFIDSDSFEDSGVDRICKSLPGLAMSQDGRHWARIEGEHHTGALFDVGSDGEWDSLYIASPQVVYHGAADLRMYYHSFDVEKGHFAVGIARSRDGIKWVKLGKIIREGANGTFDELGVLNARVLRDRKDEKYVMVYEGVAANGGRSIGVAVSSDGLKQWRRYQELPILKPSEEDGWDSEGVGSPCLVQMDGNAEEWRLYYRGIGKGGKTGIGLALSEGSEISNFQRWTGFHL